MQLIKFNIMTTDAIIRKVSIGADYKNSMSYIVGQSVLRGTYTIHKITKDLSTQSYLIWVKGEDEVVKWKSFNFNLPIIEEYDLDF